MNELYTLFASELSKKVLSKDESKRKSYSEIVQINRIPVVIDVDNYKNPHSIDNPAGSYTAAHLLFTLADEIPEFTIPFFSTSNSVKNIWGNILYSAVSEEPYVMNVLEQAKNNFKTSAMKGMGGVPEDWYLVNTRPVNWYDLIKDKSSLIRIEIDISNQEYPLFWNIDNSRQVRLDPSTALKKVYADVLVVNFLRSWLNFEVFQLNWEIKGVDQGYYSSGNLEENEGVFPLLTQSMLVGSLVTIEGEFGPRDLDFLSDQKTTRKLSLGPFSLEAENNKPEIRLEKNLASVSSSVTQIIGYISRLVPRCPD